MSGYIFWPIFIVFTAAEVYTAARSVQKKYPIALKETVSGYLAFCVFLLLRQVFRILVPYYILTLVIVSIFIQTFFGYYLNCFGKSKHFDRWLHAYGAFTYALFSYSVIDRILYPAASPKLYVAVYVAAMGVLVSTVYEITEFIHDLKYKPRKQKGLIDTDYDLICNVAGSIAAGLFTLLFL